MSTANRAEIRAARTAAEELKRCGPTDDGTFPLGLRAVFSTIVKYLCFLAVVALAVSGCIASSSSDGGVGGRPPASGGSPNGGAMGDGGVSGTGGATSTGGRTASGGST